MAKLITILLLAVLAVLQVEPRDIPSTSPLGPTYDELLYILQSRHAIPEKRPRHLTPCARAIISCCDDKKINESCSERLKCGAFFFDNNPCEDKFIIDALAAAKVFYEQFNNVAK